jgi:hypothetical protein
MTAITAFQATFDGTVGALVPTPVGGAQLPTSGRTQPTYSSTRQQGTTSAEWNITVAENTYLQYTSSPTTYGLVYLDFYLDVVTLPSATTAIVQWQNGPTSLIGSLRIYNPGTPAGVFNLQWRGGAAGVTDMWNSVTNATPDWNLVPGLYRIQLQIQPQVAESPAFSGYRLKVFSGATIDGTTPTYDSGPISSVGAFSAAIDTIRVGTVSNVTGRWRIDDILADDTTAIVRAAPATGGHYAKKDGLWQPITSQQYKAGGSWS